MNAANGRLRASSTKALRQDTAGPAAVPAAAACGTRKTIHANASGMIAMLIQASAFSDAKSSSCTADASSGTTASAIRPTMMKLWYQTEMRARSV